MSRIGENLSNANSALHGGLSANNSDKTQSPASVGTTEKPKRYDGGTVTVSVGQIDTQESIGKRALLAHAKAAGLGDAEAANFADKWVEANRQPDGKVYLQHFTIRGLEPFSDKDFAAVKAEGKWEDSLNPTLHPNILADLNERLQQNAPVIEDAEVLRIEVNDYSATVAIKNGAVDKDQALRTYVQQNLNRSGQIYFDKVDQIVNIAKLQGVEVAGIEKSDNGQTAKIFLSEEHKNTLDKLFAEAVGETQKGVAAGKEGGREATRMLTDGGRVLWNAAVKAGENIVNIPSDTGNLIFHPSPAKTEGGFARAKIGGLPEIDAQTAESNPLAEKRGFIPRFDFSDALTKYQSEQFNKDINGKVNPDGLTMGKAVDTGVSIVAPLVVGKVFTVPESPQSLGITQSVKTTETLVFEADAMAKPANSGGRTIIGRRAKAEEITAVTQELETGGVKIVKNADARIDKLNVKAAAAFEFEKGELLLRKDATFLEVFHEKAHAKQWIAVGKEQYKAMGTLAREEDVYKNIIENKHLFSQRELEEAAKVIQFYRIKKSHGLID